MTVTTINKYATVLVTGGAGYIGRHVVKKLKKAGHFPVVLDNSLPQHGRSQDGNVRINGRIEDFKLLGNLFTQYDFDAVMHFAAYCGGSVIGLRSDHVSPE